jgi:hypothetical protein
MKTIFLTLLCGTAVGGSGTNFGGQGETKSF